MRLLSIVCRVLPGIFAICLATAGAAAHRGFENDTEVRVQPDRMRVVVRASYGFAGLVLGEPAALLADPALHGGPPAPCRSGTRVVGSLRRWPPRCAAQHGWGVRDCVESMERVAPLKFL